MLTKYLHRFIKPSSVSNVFVVYRWTASLTDWLVFRQLPEVTGDKVERWRPGGDLYELPKLAIRIAAIRY